MLDVAYAHPETPGVLPIVQAGDPVLRRPATAYDGQLGDLLPRLLDAMRRTMHAAPGVGLAAPQIGIGLALAVCEDAGMPGDERDREPLPYRVLVNPGYAPVDDDGAPVPPSSTAGSVAFYEGCLSVDGWQAVVARPRRVRLWCQDETGAPVDEVLRGWPARIVQHETDHLHGELYLDHAELRSLTSHANLARHWSASPDPAPAAEALGFTLP
nr:peptide deformylase [Isoptericola halotolerans]